jgi:hypothetical protein
MFFTPSCAPTSWSESHVLPLSWETATRAVPSLFWYPN